MIADVIVEKLQSLNLSYQRVSEQHQRHLLEAKQLLEDEGVTMRTSVIEVRDMLSVFSVEEMERRIGEVPGVESVTVNHAAGGATVRYDETRLEIADIKSTVRQRGYDSAAPAAGGAGNVHEGHKGPGAASATPAPSVPKAPAPDAPTALAAPAASKTAAAATAGPTKQDNAVPEAVASTTDKESNK